MKTTSTGLQYSAEEGIRVIGLMSGTSLDGLDICYVEFKKNNGKWEYNIITAEDEGYSDELKHKLATAQITASIWVKGLRHS